MALPSGTFNSPGAGKLQVSFSGTFYVTSGADWGTGTGLSLFIRCIVDDGTDRKTAVLGFQSPTAVIEMNYAGSVDVDVSMELISYSLDGPSTVGAHKLLIRCYLIKR